MAHWGLSRQKQTSKVSNDTEVMAHRAVIWVMVFVPLRSAFGYRMFSWVVNPLVSVFILLSKWLLLKFPKYLQEHTASSRQKQCKYSHLWKSQISPWNYDWRFYMEVKPTNAYKHSKSVLYYKHNKPPPCTSFDHTWDLTKDIPQKLPEPIVAYTCAVHVGGLRCL